VTGRKEPRTVSETEAPYVHIGILVSDLEQAIERYSALGLTFMQPRTVPVERLVEGGKEKQLGLRVVFSQEGPPHWELIEAVGDGIYGGHHGEGLHHVAVLSPDPRRRRDELVRAGFHEVAAQYRDDGSMIVSYLDPADLHGIRVELLHEPVQDAILAWIAGEDATP
jgi:catechol 2,3-dioxygenase-like lactoylglutathione lyase family enzyme